MELWIDLAEDYSVTPREVRSVTKMERGDWRNKVKVQFTLEQATKSQRGGG
jgi:hypothetical protein